MLDPEIPPRDIFRLILKQTDLRKEDGDIVLDSFAENALEAAIQFRDKDQWGKVTALWSR